MNCGEVLSTTAAWIAAISTVVIAVSTIYIGCFANQIANTNLMVQKSINGEHLYIQTKLVQLDGTRVQEVISILNTGSPVKIDYSSYGIFSFWEVYKYGAPIGRLAMSSRFGGESRYKAQSGVIMDITFANMDNYSKTMKVVETINGNPESNIRVLPADFIRLPYTNVFGEKKVKYFKYTWTEQDEIEEAAFVDAMNVYQEAQKQGRVLDLIRSTPDQILLAVGELAPNTTPAATP